MSRNAASTSPRANAAMIRLTVSSRSADTAASIADYSESETSSPTAAKYSA